MAVPVRRSTPPGAVPERWDPARELEELHNRMSQLMQGVWPGVQPTNGADLWSPLVDIEETDDAWIVEAELPGVKREDVDVEVHDSELTISGEIKERERTGVLRRRTRRQGRFEYRVTLPGRTDPDRIEAALNDGVLTLRIPKPEDDKPHRVEVKSG
jgi:HSP20 family protein